MHDIIGIKKGMTQVFNENGTVVPVTIVEIADLKIARKFTTQNGKFKLVIGMGVKKNFNKAEEGQYKPLGFVPKHTTVVEVDAGTFAQAEVGSDIDLSQYSSVSKVDVAGVTKGKGFQGGVVRWGFKGGPKTHGQSDKWRSPGSIGSGTTPGRVYKGKKMAGHVGDRNKTVKNVRLHSVDAEAKLLLLRGALPGNNKSMIVIKMINK